MLKKAWLGRETSQYHNIECFTNPPQEEIPKIYQRSMIMLKTSKSEGFSLPILEAMASGCVVVCYDMGGNMDFCKDGYNCRIITKETATETIKELLRDNIQREKLVANGYKTSEQYTWQNATDKLLSLIQKQNGSKLRTSED